jgi:hypothetical protein
VSERTLEVPDPDPPQPAPGGEERSPYRNLFVPLVVVPFMVVGVLVGVFVFFGAVSGQEASIDENLARLTSGGSNESKQAAMSLVAQALENRRALEQGAATPWPPPPDFENKLEGAWESIGDDPLQGYKRLAVAQLAALYKLPGAKDKLRAILELPDAAATNPEYAGALYKLRAAVSGVDTSDTSGQLRLYAMIGLTWLDDPQAAELVLPYLQQPDPFIRQAVIGVLQHLPGPATNDALAALLDDPALETRGQAAISLSHLGDARGAEILIELLDPASYERAHAADQRKFAAPQHAQASRVKAIEALARLARAEDRALFERVAAEDSDALVREAALRAVGSN